MKGLVRVVAPICLAAVVVLPASGCGKEERSAQRGAGETSAPVGTPSSSSAPGSSPTPSARPSAPSAPGQAIRPMLPGRYLPLWPFADLAQVEAWQRAYRSGGHSPWHLDAGITALSFTRGHLGFTNVDRVVARRIHGGDARISVGYRTEGNRAGVAAVIHLLRAGTGSDAPWEVVGSDDTTLTVTTPAYAARVSSPMTVGGRITGVDESIRVQVRGVSAAGPIGTYCCVPAGGQNARWSARVSLRGTSHGVLTVAVSTGGHLYPVERFAITGVRR